MIRLSLWDPKHSIRWKPKLQWRESLSANERSKQSLRPRLGLRPVLSESSFGGTIPPLFRSWKRVSSLILPFTRRLTLRQASSLDLWWLEGFLLARGTLILSRQEKTMSTRTSKRCNTDWWTRWTLTLGRTLLTSPGEKGQSTYRLFAGPKVVPTRFGLITS